MAQAEPIVMRDSLATERTSVGSAMADVILPGSRRSRGTRLIALCIAAVAGIAASLVMPATPIGILVLLCALAFSGGVLSTWSPCGYSSLSTLRIDPPQNFWAIMRWVPTMLMHAIGYVAGGLLLTAALISMGWLSPFHSFTPWVVTAIAIVAFLYGLHQLRIIKMPYPQLRLQVSHGARMKLPKWATSFLYGGHLGLNFATYIRSPILYIVVLAAVLSGSAWAAIALVFSLNLGRFLPLLVNLLPVPDWTVQRWMAEHDSAATVVDGSILVFVGTLLLATVAPIVL